MALHRTAQGLAGLGRHGDSVLVHMQPQEVAGLQALAQSQGTSLTINPDTGMPEAFNLGDFFKSLLPTLVGGAASMIPGLQFAGMPLLTGILAGSATGALTNKDDPLMGALMGGLGGYGGASVMGAGKAAATATAPGGYSGGATAADQVLANAPSVPGMNPELQSQIMPSFMTSNAGAASMLPNQTFLGNVGDAFGGMSKAATGNQAAIDAYKTSIGAETGLGALGKSMLPVGGAVLGGLEPSDLGYGGPSIDELQSKTKYRGPLGQLNLDANYNQETGEYEGLPSLQLATGGTVNTNQSTVSTGGLQDLYGANDNTTANTQLSEDGYGIGRLDRLAQQGSLTKAGDMFYAAGGPVSFAMGGYSDEVAKGGYLDGPGDGLSDSIPATIEGKQPARLADGEFVVSADVVSALGNGSSKAGAKQLYAMMDRVRQKAHGNKRQIRKVNTRQVMPV